jgi:xeroderma pigmentosum group C-complementing protein
MQFLNHPLYCLETQVRQNQIIRGDDKDILIGRFKGKKIYKRSSIYNIFSKPKWKRLCRTIKRNQKPMKVLLPSSPPSSPTTVEGGEERDERDEGDEGEESTKISGIPLYGKWQTEQWVPPPIVNGKLPRNDHGNWEVWTKDHIPNGAVHLHGGRNSTWIKAAKHLNIDYVNAVVGFKREGPGNVVPNVHGILIESIYRNTIIETKNNFDLMLLNEQERKRTHMIEQRWSKLVRGLQIRAHVVKQFAAASGGSGGNNSSTNTSRSKSNNKTHYSSNSCSISSNREGVQVEHM